MLKDTAQLVEQAGRRAVLIAGNVSRPEHCRQIIQTAAEEFGRIDILSSNAAHQMSHETMEEISDEEWECTFATNVSAMFYLVKAALPHMGPGSSMIGSSSVNSDMPSHALLTRRPKRRSRTSPQAWPGCSENVASG